MSSIAKGRYQMIKQLSHKIVILDGYTLNPGDLSWDVLKNLGELTIYDRTPEEKIVERIGNAEIVLTNKTPIAEQILDACKNIKYIGSLATGYDVIDYKAAKERGIIVTNVPTYATSAVAQFVIALLLEVCHHIGEHSKSVAEGRSANSLDFCFWDYPLIELSGKTIGLIGMGRIGLATANLAKAHGMRVIGYDQYVNPQLKEQFDFVELDELLKESDIISLHCPLFPSTQGMINKASIAKMKDGVIIINTSRGALIVESDLAEALDSGKVYAAALDVVSTEPIKNDNPLLKAKNCIITPHIAWASRESRQRLMDIAVENVKQFLNGNPVNIVNP